MRSEKLTERVQIADFVYFRGGRVLSVERVTIDGEGRVKLQKTRPPVSPLWMPAAKHKEKDDFASQEFSSQLGL